MCHLEHVLLLASLALHGKCFSPVQNIECTYVSGGGETRSL